MSFSVKADMELLWEQDLPNTPNKTKVQAYCVFPTDIYDPDEYGSVFLYTSSVRAREITLISVDPVTNPYNNFPERCLRKPRE